MNPHFRFPREMGVKLLIVNMLSKIAQITKLCGICLFNNLITNLL